MSYSAGRGGRGGGPDRGRGGGRGGYRGGRGGGRSDLSQDMGRMNLGDRPVQRGPSGGGGGGGRPQTQGGPAGANSIELCTNYFSVDTQPDWIIYQYCITFTPEVADKNVRKRLLYFHKEVIGPRKVFDGRMLYLPKLLPQVEMQVMYQMKDGTTGHIDIKRTNELTPQSTQCVQIYNIIMRTMLHDLELKEIGRNFYMPDSYVSVPKHSLDVLAGFATSIQQCMGGLKLCIDTSFKVLCQRTALHDLYEIYDDAMKRKQDFQKMCRAELPGKIVITRYNNRTYTIEDVDFDQNPYSTFKTGDGKEMRYADYMMQQHSLKINDDKQPLLITKADRKSGKQLTLIPECCNLTGIPERMKSDVFVMKDLAVHTRLNPENRNDKLLTFVKRLNSHPKCSADLKGWQIKIPTETVKIMATILKPETLHLADGFTTSYNSYKADWTREIRDKKFMVAKHFQNWVLLTDGSSERFVADFLKTLQRVCPGMGIKVDQPNVLNVGRGSAGDYTNGLREVCGKGLPNLVVCLLPRNMADVYNAIKKVCYVQFGVPNQCIVAKTIKNPKSIMTCTTKIAMLASIKMGAELWHTNIPLGNMMVVGIDSYHDSAAKGRSVSAFVCSVNRTMSKYYSKMCFNHQYGELLDGITSCMAAGLQAYQRHNKELPQRIVIYRDGVGDGQLKSVKEYELAQFELACKNVGESYQPEITLVVCQKRVNARFSCQTNQGLGNPPPGTVIADNVTRPDWDDFFLISQSVSQGTVGPTHYVIVHAGVQALTKERLYMLTYKLCHMYYNWLGTVQVPAPCQYAHKMAYMVGSSLHAEPHQNMVETLFYL